MKNFALKIAGTIFFLISILHLLRLVFKIEVIIGGYIVPFYLSAAGFIATFLLGWWMLNVTRKE